MYYDNSKLQEESFYKDGKKQGTAKWYNQKGVLMAEYNYKNDVLKELIKHILIMAKSNAKNII